MGLFKEPIFERTALTRVSAIARGWTHQPAITNFFNLTLLIIRPSNGYGYVDANRDQLEQILVSSLDELFP